jgi:hypothetical protein
MSSTAMAHLARSARPFLPLRIDAITWDGFRLNASGPGWGFETMSPWRLVSSDRMIQGSEAAKDEAVLGTLVGDFVEALETGVPDLDPVFVLRSGIHLQVFSVHPLEPWTFVTPDGEFHFGRPSGD